MRALRQALGACGFAAVGLVAMGLRWRPTRSDPEPVVGAAAAPGPGKRFEPRLVHVIHRHGARTPTAFMIGWCHASDGREVPCELTDLTLLGKHQLHELGRQLRQHYHGLLPATFDPQFVHLRSTKYSRTIASVSCLVHGMWPGTSQEEITNFLTRQPAHPYPFDQHYLYPDTKACHQLRAVLSENSRTPETAAALASASAVTAQYRQLLAEHHKVAESSLPKSWVPLVDPINSRMAHGLPVPAPWTSQMFSDTWDSVKNEFVRQMAGKRLFRLTSGRFIYELVARMDAAKSGSSPVRVAIYSGHDTTLIPLLNAFGAKPRIWPPFASYVLLELLEEVDQSPSATASSSSTSSGSSSALGQANQPSGGKGDRTSSAALAAATSASSATKQWPAPPPVSLSALSPYAFGDPRAVTSVLIPSSPAAPAVGRQASNTGRQASSPGTTAAATTVAASPNDKLPSQLTTRTEAPPSPTATGAAARPLSGPLFVRLVYNGQQQFCVPFERFKLYATHFASDQQQYEQECYHPAPDKIPAQQVFF